MSRWWHRLRLHLARWIPYGVQGVGFSAGEGEMCSGELALELDIEGRKGTVYLSHLMWLAVGHRAGWVTEEELDKAWDEEVGQ